MSNFERGKFVAVHGIDGTGKTSTTQAVSELLSHALNLAFEAATADLGIFDKLYQIKII